MSKRVLVTLLTSAVVGGGLVAAPAVIAASPHAAKPTSVSLSSSDPKVTSSTKQMVHVYLTASNNPSTPANDQLDVTLSKGAFGAGETHAWTFAITSSVLDVSSAGKGGLKVPSSKISPFGVVNLNIAPIGKIKTRSCQGQVATKSVQVKLTGSFFFDSRSSGAHKWGTVGSKKSFTFPATNTLTWLYGSSGLENCISTSTPCATGLFWNAQDSDNNSFAGEQSSKSDVVIASRTAQLSKPAGASRLDKNTAPTKTLLTNNDDGTATLSVQATGSPGTGSATLTSNREGTAFPTPCGSGKTQNSEFWTPDSYQNADSALTVSEQIYGAITVADNQSGLILRTTAS